MISMDWLDTLHTCVIANHFCWCIVCRAPSWANGIAIFGIMLIHSSETSRLWAGMQLFRAQHRDAAEFDKDAAETYKADIENRTFDWI